MSHTMQKEKTDETQKNQGYIIESELLSNLRI